MKKIILLSCLLILSIHLKAQILAVEELKETTLEEKSSFYTQIQGITHIKDINGVLDKFVGTWKGAFDGKQLEVVISKKTIDYTKYIKHKRSEPLLWDQLLLRHKITDQNGEIIANTLGFPDDDEFIMFKDEYRNSYTYIFNYFGKNYKCGDNGDVWFFMKKNNTEAYFSYSYRGSQSFNCTTSIGPVFPNDQGILLTKQ